MMDDWTQIDTNFELVYMAVGQGASSGDAMALRFGDLTNPLKQFVITIDGGNLLSGEELSKAVREKFGTSTVDLAILTHPDRDHASGMRVLMETLNVKKVMMHRPWKYTNEIFHLATDKRVSMDSLRRRVEEQFLAAVEVEEVALKEVGEEGIIEPFEGVSHFGGIVKVLGPHPDYYLELLNEFRNMPNAGSTSSSTALVPYQYDVEDFETETLQDPIGAATTFENNSSAIFLITIAGTRMLFTGDAGVPALLKALHYAHRVGINTRFPDYFHIPHHGSRKNIGPTILNYLFGPIKPDQLDCVAIASGGAEDHLKHPNLKVTNALIRRGVTVLKTAGTNIWSGKGAPNRNFPDISPMALVSHVPSDAKTK